MHGFLNIDKPAGITSHDVVARARRLTRQRRIGHAGTLDPAATGVLVLALGQATRLIEYVQDGTRKRYTATVHLGTTTTTDDAEGEALATEPVPPLDWTMVEETLAQFRGTIQQVPPMYSALHHQGQRLYELARAGQTLDLPARPVTIYELALLRCEPPLLTLNVLCGKGTYIRSLARDLGAALGCGAHLQALRRTAVGPFLAEQALTLEQLEARIGTADWPAATLLPPETAVQGWPRADVDAETARKIRNGLPVALPLSGDEACAYDASGALVALLRPDGPLWRPSKVFDWSQ